MVKSYFVLLGMLPITLFAMNQKNNQLELCPARRGYIQTQKKQLPQTCLFCDPAVLAANYIIREDTKAGVREMLNKNPYLSSFDQGHHLMIMPIAHKEYPDNFSWQELAGQTDAAHNLSIQLHNGSYGQEYFTNWGRLSGQSVPHWHSQFKVFLQPACSLPETMKLRENSTTKDIKDAFELIKSKLALPRAVPVVLEEPFNMRHDGCLCCSVNGAYDKDKENFVIGRFKHNFVCLSHHPSTAGELSVVPYKHVSAIKDLTQDEFRENMAVAMALLSKMQEYAQEKIRDSDGGNLYTKSMGSETSEKKRKKCHVHTLVIPRTIIQPTPGTIDGHSRKLDYDPDDLFLYGEKICSDLIAQGIDV